MAVHPRLLGGHYGIVQVVNRPNRTRSACNTDTLRTECPSQAEEMQVPC